MSWTPVHTSASEWDSAVDRHDPPTPFSGTAWASFRERDGWSPIRMVAASGESLIQFLVRRPLPGVIVAWSPGGPVGNVSPTTLASLGDSLQDIWSRHILYVRISDLHPRDDSLVKTYVSSGWSQCRRTLTSGETLVRSLADDERTLRDSYSENWHRNLQRGERRCGPATLWNSPNFVEMARMYRELADYKGGFNTDWRGSAESLEALHVAFGPQLLTMRVTDRSGDTLSYRSAVLVGHRGFDLLSATSLEGRKCYASHVVTHGLLREFGQRKCAVYDFAGVDKKRNKGVFDFKKGAGGTSFTYMGEFDLGRPQVVSGLIRSLAASRVGTQ